jgi:hypothetical protein
VVGDLARRRHTTDASHPISVQGIATFIVDAPEQEDPRRSPDAVMDEPVSTPANSPCLRMKKCLTACGAGGFLHENVGRQGRNVEVCTNTRIPERRVSCHHVFPWSACRHYASLQAHAGGSGLLVRPDAAQYSKRRIVPPVGDLLRMQDKVQRPGKTALCGPLE